MLIGMVAEAHTRIDRADAKRLKLRQEFLDDLLDRTRAIAAAVEDRNLAERAAIRASAARYHVG